LLHVIHCMRRTKIMSCKYCRYCGVVASGLRADGLYTLGAILNMLSNSEFIISHFQLHQLLYKFVFNEQTARYNDDDWEQRIICDLKHINLNIVEFILFFQERW